MNLFMENSYTTKMEIQLLQQKIACDESSMARLTHVYAWAMGVCPTYPCDSNAISFLPTMLSYHSKAPSC